MKGWYLTMFNVMYATSLRNNGLSNRQIAMRMGKSYATVHKYIGDQPKFMTLANRKLGIKQHHESQRLVASHAKTMKEIAAIDKKIILLTERKNKLLMNA